jgi:hypothetical protein
MNHHWLEKQEIKAHKARFREAGYQKESPSEYVIRKMNLLYLVYSYTNTETIQAITRCHLTLTITLLGFRICID